MKPKGILFNTEAVRAILDGNKTATRRAVKQKGWEITGRPKWGNQCDDGHFWFTVAKNNRATVISIEPPYRPGDTLYVRETWRMMWDGTFRYKADAGEPKFGWNPSIHMPSEAARIFLRVTDVRVERLQDITEEQATKEGVYKSREDYGIAIYAFSDLWNSTVKKADLPRYGWDANPWCWAISFEQINKEELQNEAD